jgi:hypothetical protein
VKSDVRGRRKSEKDCKGQKERKQNLAKKKA